MGQNLELAGGGNKYAGRAKVPVRDLPSRRPPAPLKSAAQLVDELGRHIEPKFQRDAGQGGQI